MTSEGRLVFDVAIIGGGPAGLAAATELKRLGVATVAVLEREREAGGVPRHCGHYPFGMRELHRVLRGPEYAARLVDRARRAGVQIRTQTTVTALLPGPLVEVSTPAGVESISARRVLVATGVREKSRAARLIGGTKPGGVLSTGALQGLVYLEGLSPFRRPVILGTELVSFSALLTCRHAGIAPVAMIEAGTRVTAWRPSILLPRVLGVPLMLETEVVRIVGCERVEGVDVRTRSGAERRFEADGVIVSGQFLPEASLVRDSHLAFDPRSGGPSIDQFGRLSDPHYFAAGNILRPVETAGWCWAEGRTAARHIARSLAGELPHPEGEVRICVRGQTLKYAVPQRIVAGNSDGASRWLQLRVTRPVRGTLSIEADGRTLGARPISALPERRLLVPLPSAALTGRREVVLTLSEETP